MVVSLFPRLTCCTTGYPRFIVGIPALPNFAGVFPVIPTTVMLASRAGGILGSTRPTVWASVGARAWLGPSHLGYIDGVALNAMLELGLEAVVVVLVGEDVITFKALHLGQAYGIGIIM